MTERIFIFVKKNSMLLVTVVLCLLFFKFNLNLKNEFKQINDAYQNKSAINLEKGIKAEELSTVLLFGNYVSEPKDAEFIATQIVKKLNDGKALPNLYELNKLSFQTPASMADSLGGETMTERVKKSYDNLRVSTTTIAKQNEEIPNIAQIDDGSGLIRVSVMQPDTTSRFIRRVMKKDKMPASDVLVQLREHYYDSLQLANYRILGYVKTNDQGVAVFEQLDTSQYYSVLPIQKGFEYGVAQGTIGGNLGSTKDGVLEFHFIQREHTIRLLDEITYQQIREDGTLTVRKPIDFQEDLVKWLVLFFVAWWGFYFNMKRKKKDFNNEIIALLMLLTGFCLLIMFSIHNPLTDKMLGVDMAQGIIAGIIIMAILQKIDFVKFFHDGYAIKFDFTLQFINWFFKPFREKIRLFNDVLVSRKKNRILQLAAFIVFIITIPLLILDLLQLTRLSKIIERTLGKLPKGFGYLLTALVLTLIMLWTPFGEPVGGMTVNLNIFGFKFQPSEIAKYLIVIFMAAFFYKKANIIINYSQEGNSSLFGRKIIRGLFGVLLGIGTLLVVYMALGDMGPAMVLGISFILLYSIVKSKEQSSTFSDSDRYKKIFASDFAMLIYGVFSFALFLVIGCRLGCMWLSCLLWFVGWIFFGLAKKKQIFESAIFMNLIIAAFIFGGTLLNQFPAESIKNIGERLEDRREMCVNTWGNLGLDDGQEQKAGINNQVAQGLWGLASGGPIGQGIGKGNPNLIPAFHTDMILASIGEQMGWLGLVIIVVCFALLLRQCLVVGFRTGHPFAFYLATGIAIVTGVQFMIIAFGSIGIIPLTGVTVPFLSFGKVSMILNLAAFGILLSLSHRNKKPSDEGEKNIESYNYTVAISSLLYTVFSILLLLVFFNYQFWERNKTLIRPVFVNNISGVPVIEYNPRIVLVTRKLHVGNIYDREGRILATNDKEQIKVSDYTRSGINEEYINKILKKRLQRYYPFGDHMLFMVGDYNTSVPFAYHENNPIGYLAESQHLAALRGFDNIMYDDSGKPTKIELKSSMVRTNSFLSLKDTTYKIVLRDYSEITKYLKDDSKIDRFNAKREKRDIHLTVDAELQTKMQNAIEEYVIGNFNSQNWNKLLVSVVVLNASNGDMLTSANYPLPDQKILKNAPHVYDEKDWRQKAYTDRDLGLTHQTMPGSTAKVMSALAGLQKLGTNAVKVTYYIDARETVEPPTDEPNYQRDKHNTTMEEAIRLSSNNYFINLVNDKDLYESLDSIYQAVGIRIPHRYEGKSKPLTPYFFTFDMQDEKVAKEYRDEILAVGRGNIATYRDYIEKRNTLRIYEQMKAYHNGHDWNKMAWAWGQNDMGASPLNMARVAAIVANNGVLMETRFIKQGNNTLRTPVSDNIKVVSSNEAEILRGYMRNESKKHRESSTLRASFPANMGGKTGTPERELRRYTGRVDRNGNPRMETITLNDGWYIFFVDSPKENAPLAVAVRMERLPEAKGNTSRRAVELTDKVILQILRGLNYIRD